MNCYIILGTFFDMGGGQLYTKNKVNYLKEHGWKVFVYTGRNGQLYIDDLKEYKNNFIEELNYLPFYFNSNTVDKVLNRIINDCKGNYEYVVVETHKQPMAIWGELIAKRINGKHILLDLDEDFKIFEDWYYPFIDFKHKRRELAGINELSLQKMFKDYKTITDKENYHLFFPATNSIEETDNGLIRNCKEADINLGTISRLDKDYLMPMMHEIVSFCRKHRDKKVNLFVVGGAKDNRYAEEIVEIGAEANNLSLHMLGYLSPIPKRLIEIVDVFIGTAASAVMTAEVGKVTIAVDTINCKPIGIMGINASSTTFSCDEAEWDKLCDYLDYIFFEESVKMLESKICNDRFMGIDKNEMIDEHMNFLRCSEPSYEYYSFEKMGIKYKFEYLIIRTIGINAAKRFKRLMGKK